MVGYTEVIQDGHRADKYPEVGLWEVIAAAPRCGINGTHTDLTESATVRYTVVADQHSTHDMSSTVPKTVAPDCTPRTPAHDAGASLL